MKSSPKCLYCFLALIVSLTAARSQDGQLAGEVASPATGPEWYSVNTEAWDSFASMDVTRMFGTWDEQGFSVGSGFDTEFVLWGKRIAKNTFTPEFTWTGPLFGGESYTSLVGVVPTDAKFARQLWILGGWRYNLVPLVDVDIGGNVVLADKHVYGPGFVNDYGWKQRGTLYLGLIGRVLLQPSVYGIYDFDLGQSILQLGLAHSFDLASVTSIDGLSLDLKGNYGWLQANSWFARDRAPGGGQWRNAYSYWQASSDLVYRMDRGVSLSIGARYAGNNDGRGANGYNNLDLGPDQMVWFNARVSYSF